MSVPQASDVVANIEYGGDYREQLEEAARTGQCIFCKPEFQIHKLHTAGEWMVCHCKYPAKGRDNKPARFHFLFVCLSHRDDTAPLSAKDFESILELLAWCKKMHDIEGGCLFYRDGDPFLSGRTVRHPHVHYVVPKAVKGGDGWYTIPVDMAVG